MNDQEKCNLKTKHTLVADNTSTNNSEKNLFEIFSSKFVHFSLNIVFLI